MSAEIRSFVRQIEKWFNDPDSRARAVEDLRAAIKKADEDGNYIASYHYLVKLAEFVEKLGQNELISAIKYQAMLRAALSGNAQIKDESRSILKSDHPYGRVGHVILDSGRKADEKHFFLLKMERQTIFGDFYTIENLPMIDFEDDEEAQIILEDYYPSGKYHLEMIERTSLVIERLEIPVGKLEKLDVVENSHKLTLR